MEPMLNPQEEVALEIIKREWEETHRKINIAELQKLLKYKGYPFSHEKVRQIVDSLWRKGEILIDVYGRDRLLRPNHVIVNSKTKPVDFRNFTIIDKDGKPIQRIWISIYKTKDGKLYFTVSESKWNGSWKTTNHIIIPPEGVEQFVEAIKFVLDYIKRKNKQHSN